MKHTQGEWKIDVKEDQGEIEINSIAPLNSKTPSWYSLAVCFIHKGRGDEPLANAKLIAAAPDLLDIAKRTLFIFDNECNYPEGTIGYELAQSAKAAIKKATS